MCSSINCMRAPVSLQPVHEHEQHQPGHIHEAPFKSGGSWVDRVGDTWLFNAGRQIGDVPATIEIDFDRRTARWASLAGIEDRDLQ